MISAASYFAIAKNGLNDLLNAAIAIERAVLV
jgi:hypothetical protein